MKKILILGGTNYFGKKLVSMLLEQGHSITLATRGNNPIPAGVKHIHFDRDIPAKSYRIAGNWDIIFDQSCYSAKTLANFKNSIKECGRYLFASSQAVYPPGVLLEENSIDPKNEKPEKYFLNDYGQEKFLAESFIMNHAANYAILRMPVVLGIDDPRKRLGLLFEKVRNIKEKISIPQENPLLQFLDADDAARALFTLAESSYVGAINISSVNPFSVLDLYGEISKYLGVNPQFEYSENYISSNFDLIKPNTKTLSLKIQKEILFDVKSLSQMMEIYLKSYVENTAY